jgi:LuxR family maltose regulon positive regulatory protein
VAGGADVSAPGPQSVAFAKTTRPAIGSALPRDRLFARLDGSAGRTVAWISGPAGSGKTTLAASYVEARGYRCLWYQLDPDDADVATFLHYLAHAARKLHSGAPTELAPAAQGADPGSLARSLFRRLFAGVRGPFALVLDNLHAVPAESALHAALESGLGQVPKNCCVIVTSRSEPPASLARLRVTGAMVCVTGEQLRLDAEELAGIARLRGQQLGAPALAQYAERTQGWAAGLVLMLEHARLSGRIADLPGDAAPQVIFDYLAGEIFEHFEPRVREFLLRVACLPRMNAEVAQALTGDERAGRFLLNLAQNGYFVNEVQTESGRVFQLHPLLRDFLRGRAAQALPEALGEAWLRRAAELLRAAGRAEDAMALLAESRSWAELARVVAEEAPALLAQGRLAVLEAWLDVLPPELRERDPRLLLAAGLCLAPSSPRAAQHAFERAHEAFADAGDERGMASSARGAIAALTAEFDDLAPLERWASALKSPPADSATARALAQALLLRDPGSARLKECLERAGDPWLRAAASLLRGDLAAARAQMDGMRARPRDPSQRAGAADELLRSLLHALLAEHDEALKAARAGLASAEAEGLHAWDTWLRLAAAAAALGARERDRARAELQQLEAAGAQLRRGPRALLHYLRGWLALEEGDRALARREAKSAFAAAVESAVPWLECLARIAVALSLGDEGDRRARDAHLRAALGLAEQAGSDLLRCWALLAQADVSRETGDAAGALEPLRAAFGLAREQGLLHAPWWRGTAMAELCVLALREDVEAEFARDLVRARRLAARAAPLRLDRWPWAYRVRTLGRFELLRGGQPVEITGRGPGRPLELLKVLVANGCQEVRADQIADALWPHVDADYAHKSFTVTLHRLRRLLGDDDALQLRESRLSLNGALVWVDALTLEQVCAAIDDALRAPAAGAPDAALRGLVDECFALYKGPFLPDETEQPSYIAGREQLRARLLRCLTRAARRWEDAGAADAAADCYLRLIDVDPLYEAAYRNLMLCYQRCGEVPEAHATYERLRTLLAARLKSEPAPETAAVLAGLSAKRA